MVGKYVKMKPVITLTWMVVLITVMMLVYGTGTVQAEESHVCGVPNSEIHEISEIGGQCGDNLTWTIKGSTLTISGTGEMWNYNSYYDSDSGESYTDVPWWEYRDTMTKLVLEEGITSIGNEAFHFLKGLSGELIIPNSVTKIGSYAFRDCSGFSGTLTIPNSVTIIGAEAFGRCSGFTGDLVIPNGVTRINANTFFDCEGFDGILVIPDSVTTIGNGAFMYCMGLTGELQIPNSVTSIERSAFGYCRGLTGDLTIPDSVNAIGESVFEDCDGFTGIVNWGSLTEIPESAFSGCSGLTYLSIPDSISKIERLAFLSCGNLLTVEIESGVLEIGERAFSFIGSSEVYKKIIFKGVDTVINGDIGGTVICGYVGSTAQTYAESYGKTFAVLGRNEYVPYEGAKYGLTYEVINDEVIITVITNKGLKQDLGELVIPKEIEGVAVTAIGNYAFSECSGLVGELVIPDSVTEIGEYAFRLCTGLTGDLIIPNSITTIGAAAFSNCRGFAGGLTLSNSVISIGESAFGGCINLSGELKIPDSVMSIGDSAFSRCSGFEGELIIPDSVTSIGSRAFSSSVQKITFKNAATIINGDIGGEVICGYAGSTAQTYAETYGKNFIVLNEKDKVDFIVDTSDVVAQITMTNEEHENLLAQIVTVEEQAAIDAGQTVTLKFTIAEGTDKLSETDKQQLERVTADSSFEVGLYLDIAMSVQVGDNEKRAVTEVPTPIEIVIGVPEELQQAERKFSVVRLHEGVAQILEDLDENPETVTIQTDRFSSYTLVYEVPKAEASDVEKFVERMYTVALARDGEQDGIDYWVARLLSGDNDGAGIAHGFLLSPEFVNKGHADNDYVKVLYATFFDREPAAEEVGYWTDKLANGNTREFVLAGFVNSNEFDNLCAGYGISRGFLREDGTGLNPGIIRFTERLYTKALERDGEKEGIEYWALRIADGVATPEEAAKSFFLSPEYINRNTTDEHYVKALYRTFMDREAEADGITYWQNVMNEGATREAVLTGFAQSPEFKQIMAGYGL